MEFVLRRELRPCLVNGEKGLFHEWEQFSEIIPPSPMLGGHGGGVIGMTYGLVEFENGEMKRVNTTAIKFVDTNFEEYCFDADEPSYGGKGEE